MFLRKVKQSALYRKLRAESMCNSRGGSGKFVNNFKLVPIHPSSRLLFSAFRPFLSIAFPTLISQIHYLAKEKKNKTKRKRSVLSLRRRLFPNFDFEARIRHVCPSIAAAIHCHNCNNGTITQITRESLFMRVITFFYGSNWNYLLHDRGSAERTLT